MKSDGRRAISERGGDREELEAANLAGSILNEIAMHAEANPHWLDLSTAL